MTKKKEIKKKSKPTTQIIAKKIAHVDTELAKNEVEEMKNSNPTAGEEEKKEIEFKRKADLDCQDVALDSKEVGGLLPDSRFDLEDNKKEVDKDEPGKAETDKKEKPFGNKFKQSIKKEERRIRLLELKNRVRAKLGMEPKAPTTVSYMSAISFWFLKILDFGLNSSLITFMVFAAYLGVQAIRHGEGSLRLVAICIFIFTLSHVLEKIKG